MTNLIGRMNFYFIFALCFCCVPFVKAAASVDATDVPLSVVRTKSTPSEQQAAVTGLIQRTLPQQAYLFHVSVIPSLAQNGQDVVHVEAANGNVNIEGSSGVAAAMGLNYYLKYHCDCQVSWEFGQQLQMPQTLPDATINITSLDRFRYYQNVCTLSYSFAWWNWNQWEQHIDWMALNGINLPLAFIGQEGVWDKVYKELGLNQSEIDEHFTGPAFLAWGRMGNIRGWGGPLPASWHTLSFTLQRQILDRMRQFGMTPVLPAFAGHVPRAIVRIFPDANVTKAAVWNSFEDTYCCPYLLSPEDPLFSRIGGMFMQQLIGDFGTDHIYNCDTFNEMTPGSDDPSYLAGVGQAVFAAMTQVDADAIWMMQNWLFVHDADFWTNNRARALLTSVPTVSRGDCVWFDGMLVAGMMQGWLFLNDGFWTAERAKALLTSVPQGRLLVLDLQSELNEQYTRLESYYGQPFIWCMLNNFGGTLGLYGTTENVNQGVFAGRSMVNSSMVGIGITPEGINQNYATYDLMLEMTWQTEPVDLKNWFGTYALRRYGKENANATTAWQLLQGSVYNATNTGESGYMVIFGTRPSLGRQESVWYNANDVVKAWDLLIAASTDLDIGLTQTMQHDLVDVGRQVMQLLAAFFYTKFTRAFQNAETTEFSTYSTLYLRTLEDLDILLKASPDFSLDNWVQDARSWGTTPEESDLYEWNARNQISLWGPNGEILDYANKQWTGVVSNYFYPRWSLFIEQLNTSLSEGTDFNQSEFNKLVFEQVEKPFALDHSVSSGVPKEKRLPLVYNMYRKWRTLFNKSVAQHFKKQKLLMQKNS